MPDVTSERFSESRDFYVGLLGFTVEWRPDLDNVYLRLGDDNLALHRHLPSSEDDARAFRKWHLEVAVHGAILHRDG